mmetsp:Transcript_19896/g.27798  ORF Transcript_19896/g.27798 Transcript_19896/m.27798 type:complete len:294 (+) Transcript_19896:38-919(+)
METKPPFQIQLMSDLHLEFGIEPQFDAKAPILILAGDIGNPRSLNGLYQKFLGEQSKRYEWVLLLAGNHEYYANEYHIAKIQIQELCNTFPNVKFMDKLKFEYQGVVFLGATLWSCITPEAEEVVSSYVNDYKKITILDPPENPNTTECAQPQARRITVADTVKWHMEELSWIKTNIAEAVKNNQKVVVITHHAPLTKGVNPPEYEADNGHSIINQAFVNNLRSMMGEPILCWCFGHTHYSCDFNVNGTRIISNQFGYQTSNEKTGWKADLVINIDASYQFPKFSLSQSCSVM